MSAIVRTFRSWTLLAVLLPAAASAVEEITLELGDLQGAGWQAQSIAVRLQLPPDTEPAGEITLAAVTLPEPVGRLEGVRMQCDRLVHEPAGTRCTGRLRIAQLLGEPVTGRVELRHDAASGQLSLKLADVTLAGGVWQIDGQWRGPGWTLAFAARQVAAAALSTLAGRLGYPLDYQFDAPLDLSAQLEGTGDAVDAVHLQLTGQGIGFANAAGTRAGEGLAMEVRGRGQRKAAGWSGELEASFRSGALFIDPLYFEFTPASAAQLSLAGDWQPQSGRLQLHSVRLEHAGVARAQGQLTLAPGQETPLQRLLIDVHEAQLPAAFDTYLQPWIRGHLGDVLKTSGRISARVVHEAGGDSSLRLVLHQVDIDDPRQRFGFEGLSGVIDWGSDVAARTTELSWASGSLYRLALGPAQLAIRSQGTSFELREPIVVPLLDGQLMIDDLALSDPGGDDLRWRFDGVLTPVSMEAVCAALDWPPFGGQLSGMIPAVKYADQRLEIGGVLLVKAFDGDLTVRNLRLEEPFGQVPRLNADLTLDNLDLDALTRTFSFGKIEGRLSGQVQGLEMQAWEPVAFDARFATPDGDDSRHRISQKAVDNLSSIGGGVGGALSRSFLGVFEEFPYDRLGLSCRLRNGVCAMGGVAPAANGYYIVKGRFLPPRIDVVGFADQVDWHTLIDRLKAVTLEQGPTIQ